MQGLEQKLFKSLSKACGIERVQYFLDQRVDITAVDEEGNGILHYAVENSCGYYSSNIALFIKKGANVLHKNNKGETPLFKAAALNYSIIVKLLLQADISSATIKDNLNLKPSDIASDAELKKLLDIAEGLCLNNDLSSISYHDIVKAVIFSHKEQEAMPISNRQATINSFSECKSFYHTSLKENYIDVQKDFLDLTGQCLNYC